MTKMFDTTDDISNIVAQAIKDGYVAFGRYINNFASWKTLQLPEAQKISAEGGKIISIFETTPTTIGYFTSEEARRDIAAVHEASQQLGQPRDSAWYLTVDFPAGVAHLQSIIDYFTLARELIQEMAPGEEMPYKLGAYGDGAILNLLLQKGVVEFTYLAGASSWPGSSTFKSRATLIQSPPEQLYGLSCDPVISYSEDYGGWSL